MSNVFALTLLVVGFITGNTAWAHHKYVPEQSVDITENGNLTTTENAESQYGSSGKNVPYVQQ